jgi:hypothetical protein
MEPFLGRLRLKQWWEPADLLNRVFCCAACTDGYGFESAAGVVAGAGYFKFPHTIGATGPADLLFVGINPRRSSTNMPLVNAAMRTPDDFRLLSENREPRRNGRSGARYVRPEGTESSPYAWEGHYAVHAAIVEAVWDKGAPFEDHAAVTELYYCSTLNTGTGRLPLHWDSPCMQTYFDDVFAQVQPKVIIAVGAPPRDYFRNTSRDDSTNPFVARIAGRDLWVFVIGHPGDTWSDQTIAAEATKQAKVEIRRIIRESTEPVLHPVSWPRLRSRSTRERSSPPRGGGRAARGRVGRRADAGAASETRARDATGPSSGENWWPRLLVPRPTPPRGRLLESHPQSQDFTRRLLANLTVERLVRIANVQHNYCGPKDLRRLSPTDRSRDAELARRELRKHSNIPQGGANGWTGAIKLLTPSSDAGLARVREMRIGPFIGLCTRLVDGPYAEANARGIR